MLRGYRCAIVAAFGWLALTGADESPQNTAQTKQQQAASNKASGVPKVLSPSPEAAKAVEPPEYYEPCGNARSEGKSDLCAQWSAAKAAQDAARWAWWQMWLSALGVIGLGITLWFNFRALDLAEKESEETKGALSIAERNAAAAAAQVKVAQENAKRQLRPYVHIEKILPKSGLEESREVIIFVKNFGMTPATEVTIEMGTAYCPKGQDLWPPLDYEFELGRDIPPQHFQKSIVTIDHRWDEHVPLILNGEGEFRISFKATYSGFGIDRDCTTACIRVGKSNVHVPIIVKRGQVENQ